ncbi:MAG: hypothetical protein ACM3UZ_01230, partial [Acidobacteriota bacterium]
KDRDLNRLINAPGVNSLRYYSTDPELSNDFTSGVLGLCYPRTTTVLDVMDLLPKVNSWLNATPQTMGNWTSKDKLEQQLKTIPIKHVPVYQEDIMMDALNAELRENRKLTVIGFDTLQIPRYKLVFKL